MDITAVIKNYVVAEFLPGVQVAQLDDEYDLIASGVLDSLSLLRVINWLEHSFGTLACEVEVSKQDFVSVAAISRFMARVQRVSTSAASKVTG
jgi:aryl carrier-like protein